MIVGYKAFNNTMENRYGVKFEKNKKYSVEGKLQFGNNGNGFHFCKNLEDTLRYVNAMNEEIKIALVSTDDRYLKYDDEYYGYYDMYVSSSIVIEHILTRDEILKHIMNSNILSINRFLSLFRLADDEIKTFKQKYAKSMQILDTISYYQEKNLDTYTKSMQKVIKK